MKSHSPKPSDQPYFVPLNFIYYDLSFYDDQMHVQEHSYYEFSVVVTGKAIADIYNLHVCNPCPCVYISILHFSYFHVCILYFVRTCVL